MDIDTVTADLKHDEGLRLKPYRCTAGKLTIGFGRNLDDVGISEHEADTLLYNDIMRAAADLDRNAPWWRQMSPRRQAALCEMAFNLGWPRLSGFKDMLSALQSGNYHAAAVEALDSKWAKQVGDRAARVAAMFM